MSTDEDVSKDLIETLEDGKEGYRQGAEKLADSKNSQLAGTFRELSAKRGQFSDELRGMAKGYGDDIKESGSVVAKLHRGWMSLKDAVAGDDPDGVLKAAQQGDEHAGACQGF